MSKNEISDMLDLLFRQAQMQFGSAIKSSWFHQRDDCPGCGLKIDAMKFKGKKALSLNAFIFREHGVLIGYLLCGKCAKQIHDSPTPIPLHAEIEKTLKQDYLKRSGH